MSDIKVYDTTFSQVLGEGPAEFHIPIDINHNSKPDEIVVYLLGTSLYVDGHYAGNIGIDDPRDSNVVMVQKVEVGELDDKKGIDARFTLHADFDFPPIFMSYEQLLAKWKGEKKFERKLKNFSGIKKASKNSYSNETIVDIVKWVKSYKGVGRIQALQIVHPILEKALTDPNLALKIKLEVLGCFSNSFSSTNTERKKVLEAIQGQWPEWSFEPIYHLFINPKGPGDDDDRFNIRNAASWALGGAKTPDQIKKIGELLNDPNVHWENKKGFIASLGATGKPEALEAIINYAKGPIADNDYPMMIIPLVLLVDFDNRQAYWDLQIYYANLLATYQKDPLFKDSWFAYLGYDSQLFKGLRNYSQLDLDSINIILQKLEERKVKFGLSEILEEEIKEWEDLRHFVLSIPRPAP